MVLLGFQLLQKVEGPVAQFLAGGVPAVGEEHGHTGVDDEQVDGERRQVLGIAHTLGAEGVVGLPVGCHLSTQSLGDACHVRALHEL